MYFYTDKEELDFLRAKVDKLNTDNANLLSTLAEALKECGRLNRLLSKLKRVINDHITYDKNGKAEYITCVKTIVDLLEDNPDVKSGK